MPILPNNTDPSKDYVTTGPYGQYPNMTVDGLVVNGIYAYTGIIDTLNDTKVNGYFDPSLNIINSSNGSLSLTPQTQTQWFSNGDFSGVDVILTQTIANGSSVYYNTISLSVLNVPCFVELGYIDIYNNWNALPGTSTWQVIGGTVLNTTTDWVNLVYSAPSTQPIVNNQIAIRITRTSNTQTNPANVPYSVGIENFSIKLNVQQLSDVPSSVVSGTNSIITQNRFGFAETYTYLNNPTSNMFANNSTYWKCAPQPVGDSVVFTYVKISDPSPTRINRLYIDPLYSNCSFNVYYTTNSSGTLGDPGNFTWTPIQRDFTLRKGVYEIPMISCTYLKLEFTKLVPDVYDLPFDSVQKTINVFPMDVENYFTNIEQNIMNGNAVKYSVTDNANLTTLTQQSNNLSASTLYGLSSSTSSVNNWSNQTALNNSQLGSVTTGLSTSSQIIDPSSSYKLIDQDGNYNQTSYTQFLQRRFPYVGTHTYNVLTINQSWHEAYFVGIRYITTFYESMYDDLRSYSNNLTLTNLAASGSDYVSLNANGTAITPWMPTIDSFSSFNIAGLTSDWKSFLSNGQTMSSDITLLNNLTPYITTAMTSNLNSTMSLIGPLGFSSIYSISGNTAGLPYGVRSFYSTSSGSDLVSYTDANFIPNASGNTNWYGLSGSTVASTSVSYSGVTGSGTASGILVTGSTPAAAYTFTIPGVYSASGTKPWSLTLGNEDLGTVGYASYVPASGINYYFLVNLQSSGTTNVTLSTQFINPTTSGVISGTLVSGSTVPLAAASGTTVLTATGTNYTTSGFPSNTIQLVLSGSTSTGFEAYEMGVFTAPTTIWSSPANRINMRISGVARMFLPQTNNGSYRIGLHGVDNQGNDTEITYKTYQPNMMPLNTWFDVELSSYTSASYANFYVVVNQVNPTVSEPFYISMLAPFYHPVRYEYITQSGATNWQPITIGVNNPDIFIATVSGVAASGIQVRMTALDSGTFISGLSVLPQYKQNSYYANLDINYIGNSKTNELSARQTIDRKPFFLLNKEVHPSQFDINRVSENTVSFSID